MQGSQLCKTYMTRSCICWRLSHNLNFASFAIRLTINYAICTLMSRQNMLLFGYCSQKKKKEIKKLKHKVILRINLLMLNISEPQSLMFNFPVYRWPVWVHFGGKARWGEKRGLHPAEQTKGSECSVWWTDEGGGTSLGQFWGWQRCWSHRYHWQRESLCW